MDLLIYEVIIPLNSFIQEIRNSVKDSADEIEVYEKLSDFLLTDVKDEKCKEDFKFFCEQLAPFWKNIERPWKLGDFKQI